MLQNYKLPCIVCQLGMALISDFAVKLKKQTKHTSMFEEKLICINRLNQ